MDEQRLQTYLELIQKLLDCPEGLENEVLQQHTDLKNAELVQVALAIAEKLRQQGKTQAADWLENFATQLARELDITNVEKNASLLKNEPDDDAQRVDAYLQLIRKILSCPVEKESEILQQHLDLLDFGLVQTMEKVIDQFRQNGNIREADWLDNQRTQLIQRLGISEETTTIRPPDNNARDVQRGEAYLQVIRELTDCPNGKESEVLERHQDLVDAGLVNTMFQLTTVLQQQGEDDGAKWLDNIATKLAKGLGVEKTTHFPRVLHIVDPAIKETLQPIIRELSYPIRDRRAIPQRIALCQQGLALVDQQSNPPLWAYLQGELGNSIRKDPLGDRADNIEQAIAAYKRTLEVYTRTAFPKYWATAHNNLAIAYLERIQGEHADNIEQAIAACQSALEVCTREAFPEEWAKIQNNLATAYSNRIRGDRADNIEQAIAVYEQIVDLYNRDTSPEEWANTQNNLAIAYSDKIRGDRADNIEQAIAAYERALEIYNRDMFPEEWARTQCSLAPAYRIRIRGNRADNIERAITLCEQALEVYNRNSFPEEWARTQHNLAIAYSNRIRGNRADNIERSIVAHKSALEIRTRTAFPENWAATQSSLAAVYADRIRGDRASNIEQAVTACKSALEVYTRTSFPENWALTQNNLATAYADLITGDNAENKEKAITACKSALEVYTRTAFPENWATTQNILASIYRRRIRGNSAKNIEQAIAIYEHILEVYTRIAFPEGWARTQNNLADVYVDRILGDSADNIEQAILLYEQALEVYTRTAFPEGWARTQNDLATAYLKRLKGDSAENIEQAIIACRCALEIYSRETFPQDWARTQNSLANAYYRRTRGSSSIERLHYRSIDIAAAINAYCQILEMFTLETHPKNCRIIASSLATLYAEQEDWTNAQTAYSTALAATEILYQTALFKNSQEAELSATKHLYRYAAYAYARMGNLSDAVATIERGRARGLREILQRDRSDLEGLRESNNELVKRYKIAASAMRELESAERSISKEYSAQNEGRFGESKQKEAEFQQQARQVRQARQSLQACVTEIRQVPGYENFLALPTFSDITANVQPHLPLVYLLHTPNGSLALVLSSDGITDLWLDDLTNEKLMDLLNNSWLSAYDQAQNNRRSWFSAIDQVTHQLWNDLIGPVVEHLQQHQQTQVVLIPTGYLSLLPLHAAWISDSTTPTGRCYACDYIHFTYAPNAQSLNTARNIATRTPATKLLAVSEPLPVAANSLPSASVETAKAIFTFPGKGNWKILQREAATRADVLEALPHYSVAHFSCHGKTYRDQVRIVDQESNEVLQVFDILDSGLAMAHNETLTLRDLLDLNLQLRLAILSACETGIPSTELPDEAVSLPTGLIQAGAAGVISSLWSVADLSTMLLLSRFYDLWRPQDPSVQSLSPSQALRQAQLWLRDSTSSELVPYLQSSHPELAAQTAQTPTMQPFSHPFYWAAFTYIGV